jgi:hypothetical protein
VLLSTRIRCTPELFTCKHSIIYFLAFGVDDLCLGSDIDTPLDELIKKNLIHDTLILMDINIASKT